MHLGRCCLSHWNSRFIATLAVVTLLCAAIGIPWLAAADSVKHPVPTDLELHSARRTVQDLFNSEYEHSQDSTEAKDRLAQTLFETAKQTRDDVAGSYWLLMEAYRLAKEAGNITTTYSAAEELNERFQDVDVLRMKADACEAMSDQSVSIATANDVAKIAANSVEAALVDNSFQNAEKFLQAGVTAAERIKKADLLEQLEALKLDVQTLQKQYEGYESALEILKTNANDLQANRTVGVYLALRRQDWGEAEEYLVRSGDEFLRGLVAREFLPPTSLEERVELADGWWDFSENIDGAEQLQAKAVATRWYAVVFPELTGLSKKRVGARIDQVPSSAVDRSHAVTRRIDDQPQSFPTSNEAVVFLTDLDEVSTKGWEYLGIKEIAFSKKRIFSGDRKNPEFKPIVLGGKESPHGIVSHPTTNGKAEIVYRIDHLNRSWFRSTVGVADLRKYGPHTPPTFEVWGDGKKLWQSKPVKKWGEPQDCLTNIEGVDMLTLRVVCPGDAAFAQTVWCEPRLSE